MCATSYDSALHTTAREMQAPPSPIAPPEALTGLCADMHPEQGIEALVDAVNALMPELEFRHVLTRGGWHRLGGVVDRDYQPLAGNIRHWAETECGGDMEQIVATYADAGCFATRIAGTTHFFTAAVGDAPEDFVQIEVEELQEQLDRPLVDQDWYPDSIEEFLEPLDYPRLEPEPVAQPYYQFRRITHIARLLPGGEGVSRDIRNIKRFLRDWAAGSAGDQAVFSHHWVLALREYVDREGCLQLMAKPVPTFAGEMPALPGGRLRGAELANAIHGYDRRLGYPFAWYFMMLSRSAGNFALAEAVLADLMGAYDYLPSRDLKVLREWEQRPYGV